MPTPRAEDDGRDAAIARVWTAATGSERAAAYRDHFAQEVLPVLRAVPGFLGATVMHRARADRGVDLVVTTFWASRRAVEAFAGPDVDRAVVGAPAAALLDRFDDRVDHYEVDRHGMTAGDPMPRIER